MAGESVFTLHGTILVADDAPDYLHLMERILEKEGHSVLEATDGASALETLIDTKVDLIITDCTMSRMGGPEMISKVKRLHPALPFILVSSTARKKDFEKFNPSVMLTKPFYLKDIVVAVDETVDIETSPNRMTAQP